MKYINIALRKLQKDGYIADIVERRVSPIVTHDLFEFIDIIAMDPNTGQLTGVQVTSQACMKDHLLRLDDKEVHHKMDVWRRGEHKLHLMIFKRYKDRSVRCETYVCYIHLDNTWRTEKMETKYIMDSLR
jgi:hypothetical protein